MDKNVDLLIGGSPCQDLSIAKKNREGLKGSRSGLFYEYVRILKEINPKYFLLENVNSMSKESKDEVTKVLGVEPVMINAALVSAQNRKRLFWANFPITQPEDKGILLKDILQPDAEVDERMVVKGKSFALTKSYNGAVPWNSIARKQRTMVRVGSLNNGLEKANSITTVKTDSMVDVNNVIRKLTPIECERLQSLPDNFTSGVSNSQRYKALGNAFNCEVIKHILKAIT